MPARLLTHILLAATLLALSLLALPPRAEADSSSLDKSERALLREVNRTRAAHGLRPLHRNKRLQKSADYHCWDMLRANFFAHSSSNGTPFQTRVKRYTKKKRIGENLAYLPSQDARTAATKIVQMWMGSAGHREALLSKSFSRIGIARRIGKWDNNFRVAVYTADFASAR
jgi:uncharacterized protein YkwD